MFDNFEILNPKQNAKSRNGRINWYPYYAGFSTDFAHAIFASSRLQTGSRILDPWNGSGTTAAVAVPFGYYIIGYDLNPAMVIACKARLLSRHQQSSLWPIASELIDKVKSKDDNDLKYDDNDPLTMWIQPNSAKFFRKLEQCTRKLLINEDVSGYMLPINADVVSDIAAFYYIGLFRTLRAIIKRFIPSNPTWVKRPHSPDERISLTKNVILKTFSEQIRFMISVLQGEQDSEQHENINYDIQTISSTNLPLEDESVDLILSSPPYCTRIDYAIATLPELALLGYKYETSFDELRRNLIGTSTVPKKVVDPIPEWGDTCNDFLGKMLLHSSKASKTYYFKNHVQYFDSVFCSISEISRVLKKRGKCILVVQDSYYKDIHNDLPKIFTEMLQRFGLELHRKEDFYLKHSMAGLNPQVKKYRTDYRAVESVLCYYKP